MEPLTLRVLLRDALAARAVMQGEDREQVLEALTQAVTQDLLDRLSGEENTQDLADRLQGAVSEGEDILAAAVRTGAIAEDAFGQALGDALASGINDVIELAADDEDAEDLRAALFATILDRLAITPDAGADDDDGDIKLADEE